VLAKHPCR